ncbi:MAG: STAS domain-containing protein [Phycisphaerales bacterium]|nr:STAS domain-containing protein [Phycisphaerales bacterium]
MEFIPREIDGDVFVLQADGGLDRTNAAAFLQKIEDLVKGGMNKLIIDCTTLRTITSDGLAALLRASHRARRVGGDVKIAGAGGMVMQALQVTRLNVVFGVYKDVDRARAAFRDPAAH